MSAAAHILIITSGNLSRNPRPVKEATALARAGYRITVLHPSEGEPYDGLDTQLLAGQNIRHEVLHPPSGMLQSQVRRIRRKLAATAVPFGLETISAIAPARALLARARAHRADLTIVHNEVPLWVGMKLLNAGHRVAADIEDWYSEDLQEEDRRHRPLRLLHRVESEILTRAAYVTTTSHPLSAALHQRYGGTPATVVTNSFPLQPAPEFLRADDHRPSAFFWFSQTIGPGRGIEAFTKIWSQLHAPSRFVLLGSPKQGFDQHLLASVPVEKRSQMQFLAAVPPPELHALIAQHDIGLALEVPTIPSRNLTITNKILQYLNAGLAVVATPTAGQQEVHRHAPDAITLLDLSAPHVLEELLRHPERLQTARQAARRAAEEIYCWEREEPKLLRLVQTALSSR